MWNNLSCFACLLVWVCRDTFETIRIRAKPWNLLVWILQSAELEDEPSLTGTVFYYVFWCGCIGRLRLLEQLLGDACTNVYMYIYIDSCDELVLNSMSQGLIHFHSSRKGALVRDEFIGCCSRRCRLGTLTITLQSALQCMVQFNALTLLVRIPSTIWICNWKVS